MNSRVHRPIFLVGMGRSGSTLVFEALCTHPHLAWFSQYLNRRPGFPILAMLSRTADVPLLRRMTPPSNQPHGWRDRVRVGPAEAYRVWELCCGSKFPDHYLLDVTASPAERSRTRHLIDQVCRYHGRARFCAKLTGPGRIGYLSSIFPDARFVHIVRDGRAVVRSLMHVPFWGNTIRLREPAWRDPQIDPKLADLEDPLLLAATQWSLVLETIRQEARRHAPRRYAELRYEDFLAAPYDAIDAMTAFCELPVSRGPHRFIERSTDRRPVSSGWGPEFTAEDPVRVERAIEDTLARFGYGPRDEIRPGHLGRPFQATATDGIRSAT